MSKEHGSFFSRTKFRIAEKVAPINQVELVRIGEMDFALSMPKTTSLTDFEFSHPQVSQDFSFSDEHKSFSKTELLRPEETAICSHSLLNDVQIADSTKFQFPKASIDSSALNSFTVPEVVDLSEVYTLDYEITELHDEDMRIKSPSVAGKNYAKAKEQAQVNLFSGTEDDFNREKSDKPRIPRQYKKGEGVYEFDVFDIVFPSLQPPLGHAFNNPITFPHPLYPFQLDGIQFLMENKAALLGDETGLGKSIQTITAARVLLREGRIASACIVCPKAVMSD
jgi:SNF2 family DNA or RNA helicase